MDVTVLGSASSKFGELWGISPRQLVSETVSRCLEESGIVKSQIDALYVANMLSGILGHQENLGAFYAEEIGLTCPAFKIEGACASGGLAVHNAYLGVVSKQYDTVLVVGVEKMVDHRPEDIVYSLTSAGSDEERVAGLTFPGLYAILARAYMDKYSVSERTLASVSVKNHYHGSLNSNAHFQKQITIDAVMKSPIVADPLKLLDCSPISDGASAVVLTSDCKLINKTKRPVWIAASAVATDALGLSNRKTLTSLPASVQAGKEAFAKAGIAQEDVDIAEVHDSFSIAEILAIEDLGFYERGKAGYAVSRSELTLGRSKGLITNTSGGLKACGHPVGATGVKQIDEIAKQLKGKAGKRQANGAKIGLAHNVGGSGAVAVVHILQT